MKSGSRYAIYFVPAADQPLFRFGRAVLGYDCYTGEETPHPHSDPTSRVGRLMVLENAANAGFLRPRSMLWC